MKRLVHSGGSPRADRCSHGAWGQRVAPQCGRAERSADQAGALRQACRTAHPSLPQLLSSSRQGKPHTLLHHPPSPRPLPAHISFSIGGRPFVPPGTETRNGLQTRWLGGSPQYACCPVLCPTSCTAHCIETQRQEESHRQWVQVRIARRCPGPCRPAAQRCGPSCRQKKGPRWRQPC